MGLVFAPPPPCTSAEEAKSLLQDAELCYRLANFESAYSKCKAIVSGPVFDSLQKKKQHEVIKAYIKYASCHSRYVPSRLPSLGHLA